MNISKADGPGELANTLACHTGTALLFLFFKYDSFIILKVVVFNYLSVFWSKKDRLDNS